MKANLVKNSKVLTQNFQSKKISIEYQKWKDFLRIISKQEVLQIKLKKQK